MKASHVVLLSTTLAFAGTIVGCGSATSTADKMSDDKMMDSKMSDKMADKMADDKMSDESK
jgi:hypothetical protein